MKHLLIAACLGAFTLSTGGAALAQEAAKKPAAAKKAPAKKTSSKSSKSKAKTVAAAPAVTPSGEKWQCELGNVLYVSGNMLRDEVITVHWQGRDHRLPRQATVTGADRYFDQASGLDMVVIPAKAMLFNRNAGQRLADECQTADMLAGGSAPTQAGALRAPATTPLLMAPPVVAAQPATQMEGVTEQQPPQAATPKQ
ncbi:hypothetical protein K6V92_11000 [Cupriavidus respiraculi]|uniref:hypothetical protein n=1 Tax=Cupriavidus respiraculi TaxID=195930 RepID=UPI001C9794D2|nr:hypothetical protein [Cupriavidus respiraculi]MBY4947142.1 hypothetical protein [Cupriavidus respiraculi]